MSAPTTLTYQQKLEALGARFYSYLQWTPKAGDYYTSSRPDLELYRVVKIENGIVFTEYCTSPGSLAEWPESEFTTQGFGPQRVWVPDWVLRIASTAEGKQP